MEHTLSFLCVLISIGCVFKHSAKAELRDSLASQQAGFTFETESVDDGIDVLPFDEKELSSNEGIDSQIGLYKTDAEIEYLSNMEANGVESDKATTTQVYGENQSVHVQSPAFKANAKESNAVTGSDSNPTSSIDDLLKEGGININAWSGQEYSNQALDDIIDRHFAEQVTVKNSVLPNILSEQEKQAGQRREESTNEEENIKRNTLEKDALRRKSKVLEDKRVDLQATISEDKGIYNNQVTSTYVEESAPETGENSENEEDTEDLDEDVVDEEVERLLSEVTITGIKDKISNGTESESLENVTALDHGYYHSGAARWDFKPVTTTIYRRRLARGIPVAEVHSVSAVPIAWPMYVSRCLESPYRYWIGTVRRKRETEPCSNAVPIHFQGHWDVSYSDFRSLVIRDTEIVVKGGKLYKDIFQEINHPIKLYNIFCPNHASVRLMMQLHVQSKNRKKGTFQCMTLTHTKLRNLRVLVVQTVQDKAEKMFIDCHGRDRGITEEFTMMRHPPDKPLYMDKTVLTSIRDEYKGQLCAPSNLFLGVFTFKGNPHRTIRFQKAGYVVYGKTDTPDGFDCEGDYVYYTNVECFDKQRGIRLLAKVKKNEFQCLTLQRSPDSVKMFGVTVTSYVKRAEEACCNVYHVLPDDVACKTFNVELYRVGEPVPDVPGAGSDSLKSHGDVNNKEQRNKQDKDIEISLLHHYVKGDFARGEDRKPSIKKDFNEIENSDELTKTKASVGDVEVEFQPVLKATQRTKQVNLKLNSGPSTRKRVGNKEVEDQPFKTVKAKVIETKFEPKVNTKVDGFLTVQSDKVPNIIAKTEEEFVESLPTLHRHEQLQVDVVHQQTGESKVSTSAKAKMEHHYSVAKNSNMMKVHSHSKRIVLDCRDILEKERERTTQNTKARTLDRKLDQLFESDGKDNARRGRSLRATKRLEHMTSEGNRHARPLYIHVSPWWSITFNRRIVVSAVNLTLKFEEVNLIALRRIHKITVRVGETSENLNHSKRCFTYYGYATEGRNMVFRCERPLEGKAVIIVANNNRGDMDSFYRALVVKVNGTSPSNVGNIASVAPADPVDVKNDHWSDWSSCSLTCGEGRQYRDRKCIYEPCVKTNRETQPCSKDPCENDHVQRTTLLLSGADGKGSFEGERRVNAAKAQPNNVPGDGEHHRPSLIQTSPWWAMTFKHRIVVSGMNLTVKLLGNPVALPRTRKITVLVGEEPADLNHSKTCFTFYGVPAVRRVTLMCKLPLEGKSIIIRANGNGDFGPFYKSLRANIMRPKARSSATITFQATVDVKKDHWSYWSSCSTTCGGFQFRQRMCTPEPCVKTNRVTRTCENSCAKNQVHHSPPPSQNPDDLEVTVSAYHTVPDVGGSRIPTQKSALVLSEWSDWTQWSKCPTTCGGKDVVTRSRSRDASKDQQSKTCGVVPCPVDGHWTEWSDFTGCTATCGGGTQYKWRDCSNPTPQSNGKYCPGKAKQERICNGFACPQNGFLTKWTEWAACPVTCGGGVRVRTRTCFAPQHGGKDCVGDLKEMKACSQLRPCVGVWSPFSAWSACSKTCGGGVSTQHRTCTKGLPCPQGQPMERRRPCNTAPCGINGGWGEWSSWGTCSTTCESGVRKRKRMCDHPSPRLGGDTCVGAELETKSCILGSCTLARVVLNEWLPWGPCTSTCGREGRRSRTRQCTPTTEEVKMCPEHLLERMEEACNMIPCPLLEANMTESKRTGQTSAPKPPTMIEEYIEKGHTGVIKCFNRKKDVLMNPDAIWLNSRGEPLENPRATVLETGDLKFSNFMAGDSAFYICQVSGLDHSGRKKFKEIGHSVEAFLIPEASFEVNFRYNTDSCDSVSTKKKELYVKNTLEETCKADVCRIRNLTTKCHPRIFKESTGSEISQIFVSLFLLPSNSYMPPPCKTDCKEHVIATHLLAMYNRIKKFVTEDQGKDGKINYETTSLEKTLHINCPDGWFHKSIRCVSCMPGFYSRHGYKQCARCPKGHYQHRRAQRDCIPCPDGLTTSHMASDDRSDCISKTMASLLSTLETAYILPIEMSTNDKMVAFFGALFGVALGLVLLPVCISCVLLKCYPKSSLTQRFRNTCSCCPCKNQQKSSDNLTPGEMTRLLENIQTEGRVVGRRKTGTYGNDYMAKLADRLVSSTKLQARRSYESSSSLARNLPSQVASSKAIALDGNPGHVTGTRNFSENASPTFKQPVEASPARDLTVKEMSVDKVQPRAHFNVESTVARRLPKKPGIRLPRRPLLEEGPTSILKQNSAYRNFDYDNPEPQMNSNDVNEDVARKRIPRFSLIQEEHSAPTFGSARKPTLARPKKTMRSRDLYKATTMQRVNNKNASSLHAGNSDKPNLGSRPQKPSEKEESSKKTGLSVRGQIHQNRISPVLAGRNARSVIEDDSSAQNRMVLPSRDRLGSRSIESSDQLSPTSFRNMNI